MTDAQRNDIVMTYINAGYDAASALAVEYGSRPQYVAYLLRKRGIKNTTKRGTRSRPANDPRWQRAIQVGQVTA